MSSLHKKSSSKYGHQRKFVGTLLILYCFNILTAFAQTPLSVDPIFKVTNETDTVHLLQDEWISTYSNGMSVDEYTHCKNIQWIPLMPDSLSYVPQDINLRKYTTYYQLEKTIQHLTRSAIVKAYSSSMLSTDGQKIYTIEIGKGKHVSLFTGGIHAREVANPQFLMKFACSIVNAYQRGDTTATRLLENFKIVILPCINPDGYILSTEGKHQIRNTALLYRNITDKKINNMKANANGVDLNRNFPNYSSAVLWKGVTKSWMMSYSPSDAYYAGKSLGSENETKVAMNFLEKYIPTASVYIDFHSAGRAIYAGKPHLPDEFTLHCQLLGELLNKNIGYKLYSVEDEVTGLGADGTITDYASELAIGYKYHASTGRLMPPNDTINLIRKYNNIEHHIAIATVETLVTSYGGLRTKSSEEMQFNEWEKYNFMKLFHLFFGIGYSSNHGTVKKQFKL
jgi:hypothetical protein